MRRKTPPRRPLRPGVTRLCCRRACQCLGPGSSDFGWPSGATRPVIGRRCLELSRRARFKLVWMWLPRATCASLSRTGLRSPPPGRDDVRILRCGHGDSESERLVRPGRDHAVPALAAAGAVRRAESGDTDRTSCQWGFGAPGLSRGSTP